MRRRTDLPRVNHEPRWVSHKRGYCQKATWVACQYDTLQKYEDSKSINSKSENNKSINIQYESSKSQEVNQEVNQEKVPVNKRGMLVVSESIPSLAFRT